MDVSDDDEDFDFDDFDGEEDFEEPLRVGRNDGLWAWVKKFSEEIYRRTMIAMKGHMGIYWDGPKTKIRMIRRLDLHYVTLVYSDVESKS